MPYEKDLARAWREGWCMGAEWNTTEGQSLRVLYPGFSGLSWGPDFRRAVISSQGKKIKGDVEFHVRSSEWVWHGHNRDFNYNGVILHVVWKDDLPGSTLTSLGKKIPVALSRGPFHRSGKPFSLPCQNSVASLNPELLKNLLAHQGDLWFRNKAFLIFKELQSLEPEEVLYRGIFQALGYSENKAPFYALACLIPFRSLRQWASGLREEERIKQIQELYLAISGISEKGAPGNGRQCKLDMSLCSEWKEALKSRIDSRNWRFQGLRPANHPFRRLMAAAHLVNRYLDTGLIRGLLGDLEAFRADKSYPHERLIIEDDGKGSGEDRKASLLGRGRAQLIVVNVLLPFAYALGLKVRNRTLQKKAINLFRRFPSLEENIITKNFRRLLRFLFKLSAEEMQGLLRLEKSFCSQGNCNCCPLGKNY